MKNNSPRFLTTALAFIFSSLIVIQSGFAVENSECLECHGDESLSRSAEEHINKSYISLQLFVDGERFNNSVHHINDVGCTGCHSDIVTLNMDADIPHQATLAPVDCTSCHEEEGAAFLGSIHMKARRKGITMNCYACHDYHYVGHLEAASVNERGSTFCLRCHNPYQSHDWLTQKAAHFDTVECSVCHVPDARKHIHLSFYDLVSNTSLNSDEILEILAISEAEFMPRVDTNLDGRISSNEFDDLVLMLRQKTVRTIVHAELVVELEPVVHSVSKEEAVRECTLCHAPDSPFFSAVTIALSKQDGTVDHYEVDRAILAGYHTSHFSALAGTRIMLLDKIGFLMIAGAVLVVALHLSTRIATIPIRRKREMEDQDEPDKNDHSGTNV
ncbi:MAG: hypothetical protein KKG47_11825 [Proteobacteria bacterium]|nr:hypothetical protein [Pseudomonadota bacterium]MBU1737809.1 hypothetical protein [Pseudomonadota bacterium]